MVRSQWIETSSYLTCKLFDANVDLLRRSCSAALLLLKEGRCTLTPNAFQYVSPVLPDEVCVMLSKVTTAELLMTVVKHDTVRRVLDTISLQPESCVAIRDKSSDLLQWGLFFIFVIDVEQLLTPTWIGFFPKALWALQFIIASYTSLAKARSVFEVSSGARFFSIASRQTAGSWST